MWFPFNLLRKLRIPTPVVTRLVVNSDGTVVGHCDCWACLEGKPEYGHIAVLSHDHCNTSARACMRISYVEGGKVKQREYHTGFFSPHMKYPTKWEYKSTLTGLWMEAPQYGVLSCRVLTCAYEAAGGG